MLEIPGKNPSFNLVVPAEYDLGRNTYRIEGNEMYYSAGLLRQKFSFNNGATCIFSPKNAEIGECDNSYIVFQAGVLQTSFYEVLREIDKINEESYEKIAQLLGDKIHAQGMPWMQIIRTPKLDAVNKNRNFNVMHVDGNGFFEASAKEESESSLMTMSASTYEKVQQLTRIKIRDILKNYLGYEKEQQGNIITLH